MECPYCRTENHDGTSYCNSCGKLISSTPSAPSSGNAINTNNSLNSSNTSSSLTAGTRLQGGRYIIKKMLGQGGMGAALLATDIRLDSKTVVIKELISENVDPAKLQEDVRNFKREVATLAHIDHPLVPNVTDHFQEGNRYFMVQEYIEGENLEEPMNPAVVRRHSAPAFPFAPTIPGRRGEATGMEPGMLGSLTAVCQSRHDGAVARRTW